MLNKPDENSFYRNYKAVCDACGSQILFMVYELNSLHAAVNMYLIYHFPQCVENLAMGKPEPVLINFKPSVSFTL